MTGNLANTDFNSYLAGVRDYARDVLRPNEHRLSDADGVPEKIVENLKNLGLFGMSIPEQYGGLGLTMEQQVRVMMEITWASCVYRSRFSTTVGLSSQAILYNGTDEQCRAYLPGMASGAQTGAFALTEEAAGSDAGAVETTARRDGNDYLLDGRKRYITNAPIADLFVVMARTDPASKGANGLSSFVVEAGAEGLSVGPIDGKMGQAGAPTSEVYFENCRVPASALLGEREGTGFKNAMGGINCARLHIAATCVGQATRLCDEALAYAVDRRQFDRPIAEFQSIQNMLADCRAEILAARSMTLETARKFQDLDKTAIADISCCKYFASEMVTRVADRAVQILGGAGYLTGHDVERLYRDVRLFRLFEGTSQIQQLIIAKHMVRDEVVEL